MLLSTQHPFVFIYIWRILVWPAMQRESIHGGLAYIEYSKIEYFSSSHFNLLFSLTFLYKKSQSPTSKITFILSQPPFFSSNPQPVTIMVLSYQQTQQPPIKTWVVDEKKSLATNSLRRKYHQKSQLFFSSKSMSREHNQSFCFVEKVSPMRNNLIFLFHMTTLYILNYLLINHGCSREKSWARGKWLCRGVRGRRWKIQGARVLFIYFIQDCVLRIIGFFVIILNVINKYIFFY